MIIVIVIISIVHGQYHLPVWLLLTAAYLSECITYMTGVIIHTMVSVSIAVGILTIRKNHHLLYHP